MPACYPGQYDYVVWNAFCPIKAGFPCFPPKHLPLPYKISDMMRKYLSALISDEKSETYPYTSFTKEY